MLPRENFGKLDSRKRHILHSMDRTQLIYTCIMLSFSLSLVIHDSRAEVQRFMILKFLKQSLFKILTCFGSMIHDSASTPDNIDSVLPVLSEIVRRSLTQGIFPTTLKESHVHPRLKNIKLEGDSFSSYRPVANISFLSKVTEKFASIQVHNYLR